MFVVTGATGQLGRAIVKHLVNRVGAGDVAATCRDPAEAIDLADMGVRVRRADFDEPESLPFAFEGADQLLIVSSNARASGGDPCRQHGAAIAAARQAGARRVVYTSHMGASTRSAFAPMHDHAETEELLRASGMEWTALRNGFYAMSALAMMGSALAGGEFETAPDGPVAWTDHDDLAQAAAIVLTQQDWISGPTAPLTGSQALDFGQLAEIACAVTGKAISRQIVTEQEMRAHYAAQKIPSPIVEFVLGLYRAARNGEFAMVDPALEKLLGRQPITMQDMIASSLTA